MKQFPPFKLKTMTPKEEIEKSKKELTFTLTQALKNFEEHTGLNVSQLNIIRGSGFGISDGKLLGIDVMIKL